MAEFLANVWYPPARSRRIDDTLSTPANPVPVPNGDGTPSNLTASALAGFQDFYTDQGGNATNPDTCADSNAGCHQLPLGASTNSATLNGFDAPTMRGMTDRFLQFSLGVTDTRLTLQLANSGVVLLGVSGMEAPIEWDPNQGQRELTTFGTAFLIFQPVGVTGDPPIPVIPAANASHPAPFTLTGTDVDSLAGIFLDAAPATATLSCRHPVTSDLCDNGNVTIDINQSLALGLHLLQVHNPAGPLSEEMPICVGAKADCN
jgi:hypothetical protein